MFHPFATLFLIYQLDNLGPGPSVKLDFTPFIVKRLSTSDMDPL